MVGLFHDLVQPPRNHVCCLAVTMSLGSEIKKKEPYFSGSLCLSSDTLVALITHYQERVSSICMTVYLMIMISHIGVNLLSYIF